MTVTASDLTDGFHTVPPGKVAAVVTHLEMTAPPPALDAPLPDGLTLRHEPAPDPDWYRDLFLRVGALDWLWFSRLRMARDDLGGILSDEDVEVYALIHDGRAEGLLELDFRIGDSCELAFLGLTAAMQGRGAGRAMIGTAVARAFARPIARLHVHTCTFDSPVALPFYMRAGFVPVRREVEITDDPRLTGALPESAAPHVPLIR
ncbi:GNAT family N-acetyltransferase [Jannaschia rubra]|uniref:GNAT family N-acetyltransferase n=1 Tax=Jannaschia rubra TaxID=282197 RepID=UPI002492FBA9|nr:GNAT family N-acetyltransferase [Jannaschia rubra]